MSDYLVDGADLTSIANAIRTKGGTSSEFQFPSGFINAVEAIKTDGGSTLVEVSEFTGDIYYIDSSDGALKTQRTSAFSQSVPSGSMVVLHWNGPKPPFGITLVNLSIVYSVSNGTRSSHPATDFCIAS